MERFVIVLSAVAVTEAADYQEAQQQAGRLCKAVIDRDFRKVREQALKHNMSMHMVPLQVVLYGGRRPRRGSNSNLPDPSTW